MCDLYKAADITLAGMRDQFQRTKSISIEDLQKFVNNAYFIFCSLATADAILDVKCQITQLIVDANIAGLLDDSASIAMQNKLNSAFNDAMSDIRVPVNIAVMIKCLLQDRGLSSISYTSTRDLSDITTLFSLPVLLREFASLSSFKEYLYSMICITRDSCEDDAIMQDIDAKKALRLGTLAGVYTASKEGELFSKITDKSTYLLACKNAIFGDTDATNVFGG